MHFRQTAHTKKVVECLDFRIIRLRKFLLQIWLRVCQLPVEMQSD